MQIGRLSAPVSLNVILFSVQSVGLSDFPIELLAFQENISLRLYGGLRSIYYSVTEYYTIRMNSLRGKLHQNYDRRKLSKIVLLCIPVRSISTVLFTC